MRFSVFQTESWGSSFFIICCSGMHWIDPWGVCTAGAEINTWLETSNLPPSKALQWCLMKSKVGGKLLLQGSATQIKGRNNLFFSLCFDTKISDCSQFIVLCPRLVSLRAVEQQVGLYHAGAALDFTWILRHFYPSLSQKLSCLKTPGENNHPRHLCCRLNKHKYPLRKKTQKCLTHFKAAGGIWALMSQRGETEET